MKLTLKKTIASILCISMIPSMMTGCKKESTSYSHTDFAMGTVTNITLYGTSDDLEQTEQKIIDMEKKLEKQQLSWRLKSSQVSKINQKLEQNNGKTKVTGNLKNWLQQAIKISQDSYADGRNTVDPTIGALTKLWDFESSIPKYQMQIRSRKRSAEICQKTASMSQSKTTEKSLHATKIPR